MSEYLDPIIKETRELQHQFEEMITPYRQALWNYCRYLTGSPWDGDDLFQDTLLKAFATMAQLWHPLSIKSYLFRIATNTRIDGLRKKKFPIDSYAEQEWQTRDEHQADPYQIVEAVEILVQHLAPRRIAILLLMEVFGFTASDVASIVHMTEGSVYAALHRARAYIHKLRSLPQEQLQARQADPDNVLLHQLLEVMRSGDVDAIIAMLGESVHNNATPGFQEFSKKQMLEGSSKHRGPALQVSLQPLWGTLVFVVLAESDRGHVLHDIRLFEFDNGEIVYHRGYYFCKEFLLEAGQELGIPVQLQKDPGIDWR